MHSTGCGVCGITKVTVTFCCSLLGCQEYTNSMFCVVFQSSLQVLWDLTSATNMGNVCSSYICVSRRRRKMYCGHARLCVCLSVCLSVHGRMPTLLHGPGCNLGHGKGGPLVVHCWADLQSGHGLRCYGNITRP